MQDTQNTLIHNPEAESCQTHPVEQRRENFNAVQTKGGQREARGDFDEALCQCHEFRFKSNATQEGKASHHTRCVPCECSVHDFRLCVTGASEAG